MGYNANLPALVPAVILLIVISAGAALALVWNRQPEIQTLVRRIWLGAAVFIVLGVVIFWIATAMVQGPKRATVDRTLQTQQQEELHRRIQGGGH